MTTKFAELLIADVRDSATCTLAGIVEMARLEPTQRDELLARYDAHAWPLLSQPEFDNLRMIGPWLFGPGAYTSLQGQYDFHHALNRQAGDAVCGWITSELSPAKLASHLCQANIAHAPDGECYLLRYHTEAALPVLDARRNQPGPRALFAPITSWWHPLPHVSRKAWAAIRGERIAHTPAMSPITLDDDTWHALAGDPLAYTLADQLKPAFAQQPDKDCYGVRLGTVQHYLAQAREQGLIRPGDLNDYVTLTVLAGGALTTNAHWQAAIDEAKNGGRPLSQSYKARRFTA
ncbi:MAG TPA: DUF4123 domain-containing protein [Dyella sp.]|uniref:DUF4123 domain-containing protein n=1 Tax=Dyella sp. TaxID=1869338 RepID=UPI002C5D2530|nr:DUF4123 domain-containing protein [Dyella sp.]HTV85406.1 DUF4123 domain-containing protein [Dyella sp.]